MLTKTSMIVIMELYKRRTVNLVLILFEGEYAIMIYGYCRISTPKQSIERQVRNILAVYPSAKIVKETYTGTKFQGRKALEKILKRVKANDTIVFDSVSRMSRTADEGFKLYQELFEKNINLDVL